MNFFLKIISRCREKCKPTNDYLKYSLKNWGKRCNFAPLTPQNRRDSLHTQLTATNQLFTI